MTTESAANSHSAQQPVLLVEPEHSDDADEFMEWMEHYIGEGVLASEALAAAQRRAVQAESSASDWRWRSTVLLVLAIAGWVAFFAMGVRR